MTASPLVILRREETDGTASTLATCTAHPDWHPGWNDPADFVDDDDTHPDRASGLALIHAHHQADDHLADAHPELDHLFTAGDQTPSGTHPARWQ